MLHAGLRSVTVLVASGALACASGSSPPEAHASAPEPTSNAGAALGLALKPVAPTVIRAPDPESASELVLVLGGDVNLGRHVGQRLLAEPRHQPFQGVLGYLRAADAVIVNLESPLSDQGGQTFHPSEKNVFTGPPSGAEVLAAAGIHAVSVANNHAWDYGLEGFLVTLESLSRAGVARAGGSSEPHRQFEPAVLRVRGWTVAVLAATQPFNPGPLDAHEASRHVAWAGSDEFVAAIQKARRQYDAVLVNVHAGREYAIVPDAADVERFRTWAAAGADAVIGHHPHVLQGISWHGDRPLFHSLGNLVFGIHRDHPWTARSVLVRLVLAPNTPPRVALCPIIIVQDEPHALDAVGFAHRTAEYHEHIAVLSEPLGGLDIGETLADGCFEVAPRSRDSLTDRGRSAALLGLRR